MKIFVSGANGFIGRALVRSLSRHYDVVAGLRRPISNLPPSVEQLSFDLRKRPLLKAVSWPFCDVFIHTAGQVRSRTSEMRPINLDGTVALAECAVELGARRFIFLSSASIYGKQSKRAFLETDNSNPPNLYAELKAEAENKLLEIASQKGLEVFILRLPLVYSYDALGPFGLLCKVIGHCPLPLARIDNSRSVLALSNLVDCISRICGSDTRVFQGDSIFNVKDKFDISTSQLVSNIAKIKGVNERCFYAPKGMMSKIQQTFDSQFLSKVFDDFQINDEKIRSWLDWEPSNSMLDELSNDVKYINDY